MSSKPDDLLRKIAVGIFLVLIVALTLWLLDRVSILPLRPILPEYCLPVNAGIVISLPEMEKALRLDQEQEKQEPLVRALLQLPGLQQDLELINSLIDTLFSSRVGIDRTRGLVSLQALGKEDLGLTWILDLRFLGKFNLPDWFRDKNLFHQGTSFRKQMVWTVEWDQGKMMAISKFRNLLIMARLPLQVEAALANKHQRNNWLSELTDHSNASSSISVYFNAEKWTGIRNAIFSEEGQQLIGELSQWFNTGRFDFSRQGENYQIQGVLDVTGGRLQTPILPSAYGSDLWSLLPNNTGAIKAINLADYSRYIRQNMQLPGGRFQRYFLPWMDGPAVSLTLRPFNAAVQERQIFFLRFSDRQLVDPALNKWMEEVGILQTINYQGFTLTQVNENENLFPFSQASNNNPWWTIAGNYLLLTGNRVTLENWIDQYTVGSALPLTEVSRQLIFSSNGGQFSFFLDWQQWRTAWKDIFRDHHLANALSRLGQLSYRIKSEGEQSICQGLWSVGNTLEADGDLSWRLTLPTEIAGGPWLCQNSDSDMLLAVQDKQHQLYAFTNEGKVLWQMPVNHPILSKVSPILLKDQAALIFNTRDAIHLLDLQGQPIAPFPLKLRNETETPLTVIDFYQNKNYQFFVVSPDGCVYGFDLQGGPVSGWSPKCQLGPLDQPLLHFQDQNQDYLLVQNAFGAMRAFAKDGSPRLGADFPAGSGAMPPQVQLIGRKKQVVTCSDSGLVQIMPLVGEPFHFRLPVGNNTQVKMFFENFAGDARKDFLLVSERTVALHLQTSSGTRKQFEKVLPLPVDQVFVLEFPNGRDKRIGLLLIENQRIYLLDKQGKVHPDFPMAGTTPFLITDLFGTGESHLIVGYQDEILAYLLGN